jgi:hypothetical protein
MANRFLSAWRENLADIDRSKKQIFIVNRTFMAVDMIMACVFGGVLI